MKSKINTNWVDKGRNYFIFGYFGWFNAGDDAIGYSVIESIVDKNPHSYLSITIQNSYFSHFAKKYYSNTHIKFINFNFFSIIKEIINADFFIFTGGTHFHDEDQYSFRRISLFLKLYGLTLLARSLGKRAILLGHGIGPVSKFWSKILLKGVLSNSKFIFVRDNNSKETVENLGYSKKCYLGFDCSSVLFNRNFELTSLIGKTIGISLLPAFSIYSKSPEKDYGQLLSLSKIICNLKIDYPDLHIVLFAFRTGNLHSDTQYLKDLINQNKSYSNIFEIIEYDGDILGFIAAINKCHSFIGMRYHSSLFAYLLSKPQIMIDYMGKCSSLAHDISLPDNAIIPLEDVASIKLGERIRNLIEHPDGFKAKSPPIDSIEKTRLMFNLLMNNYFSLSD